MKYFMHLIIKAKSRETIVTQLNDIISKFNKFKSFSMEANFWMKKNLFHFNTTKLFGMLSILYLSSFCHFEILIFDDEPKRV